MINIFIEYAQCAAHRNKQTMNTQKHKKNSKMSLSYRDKVNVTTELSVQNMTIQYP